MFLYLYIYTRVFQTKQFKSKRCDISTYLSSKNKKLIFKFFTRKVSSSICIKALKWLTFSIPELTTI